MTDKVLNIDWPKIKLFEVPIIMNHMIMLKSIDFEFLMISNRQMYIILPNRYILIIMKEFNTFVHLTTLYIMFMFLSLTH